MKKLIGSLMAILGGISAQAQDGHSVEPNQFDAMGDNIYTDITEDSSELVPVVNFGGILVPLNGLQIQKLQEAGVTVEDLSNMEIDLSILNQSIVHAHN